MSNGDEVRSMTDEELAEIIMCPYNIDADTCNRQPDCVTCCEEWLKSLAESEEENG